ncbi:septum formation family protein [Actinomadura sp. 9N407]|uniref:DUF4190 domain-containing protein n=1 Tax=Actinomadura sp. 9N407 TaxID=3375154 RepID=UPI0037B71A4C
MALVTGLLGLVLFAVGFGIAALVQISRRGERGKGLAIGGIVASVVWLMVSVALAITALSGDFRAGFREGLESSTNEMYPKPGQCFDLSGEQFTPNPPLVACDRPHDAEMVLHFKLPKGAWPGDKELSRLSDEGCEQRFRARFKTRAPLENSASWALPPNKMGWRLGDRTVYCAVVAVEGESLTRPIGSGPARTRALEELRPGNCFADPKEEAVTVTLAPCDGPHGAQLTHRFELPTGAFPGDVAVEKKAAAGCEARWNKMFGKDPSPVRLEHWYLFPSKETWSEGDRLALCYVTDERDRDLTRSVIPD